MRGSRAPAAYKVAHCFERIMRYIVEAGGVCWIFYDWEEAGVAADWYAAVYGEARLFTVLNVHTGWVS